MGNLACHRQQRWRGYWNASSCPALHCDLTTCRRCLPAYTHPTGGALNLACHLPWYTRLPDLGPKGYIAFGRCRAASFWLLVAFRLMAVAWTRQQQSAHSKCRWFQLSKRRSMPALLP